MASFIFYTEYSETLDLFFSDTINHLVDVKISTLNQNSLFKIDKDQHYSSASIRENGLFSRFLAAFRQSYRGARRYPEAIHVYVLPIHIMVSPFVNILCRHNYAVVSQGQLEGEGIFTSTIYRLFLAIAARLSLRSFSCNIFETYRWPFWPFCYLSSFLKPLPWYGLTLSRDKLSCFNRSKSSFSSILSKPLVFGYLGRLCEAKGCTDLLKYFSQGSLNSSKLLMAGPIEASFRKILDKSNLQHNNIIIQSPVDPGLVSDWFSDIDIYITLSRGESIGASSIEALLSGKPVISVINSGSCQVLRHCVDSYLIKSADFREIDAAIKYIVANYDDMSFAASQLANISLPETPVLARELIELKSYLSI